MLSPILSSLTAYILASFLLTIAPGPDALLVMRSAVAGGPRRGVGVVCGVASAWLVWGVAAMLGLSALIVVSPIGFQVVKWIGALYLAWLGIRMIWNSGRGAPVLVEEGVGESEAQTVPVAGAFFQSWRQGLLATLSNPFVGLMVCAFFPQFIPAGVNVALYTLLLTVVQMGIALVVFGSLVFLTVPLGRFLSRPLVACGFDWATGLVLLGFGVKLALAHGPG